MKRQAKNLKVLFQIEDNAYGTTTLLEHAVSVDSTDGFNNFSTSVLKGLHSIEEACGKINQMTAAQIIVAFTEKVSAQEAREQEAAKHKDGGDMWQLNNRVGELTTENACLKKQVKDLIEQLDRNISRGE